MKKILLPLCILMITLAACKKDKCEQIASYWSYTPRYMKMDDIVKQIKTGPATPLKNVGKIYLSGNFIYVNEIQMGIHVIDNTNPSAPQNVAFISIPGNIDIATKDNILYADCYTALVAINISTPSAATVSGITYDALPQLYTTYADPVKGIVVGYDSTRVTDRSTTNCSGQNPIGIYTDNGGIALSQTGAASSPTTQPSPSQGGSMARFAVYDNTLYIVDNTSLRVFNITSAASPTTAGTSQIGWNIETIFPYDNHLYIGTSTGMQIFNLNDPMNPQHDASFAHALACDPVAVSGHYAYVTLHSGTPCNNSVNELEVVDISNTTSPTLVATYEMHSPRGVGIDGTTLFICDGDQGLKVFDSSDPKNVTSHQLGTFAQIQAEDVIPFGKKLIMIGTGGLYEYDYSDPKNITPLGHIPVSK